MVEILSFSEALRHRGRPQPVKAAEADDSFSFWPEVRCGLWVSQGTALPDPRNSSTQVLKEVCLILAGTGLLILLATAVLGVPH